MKNNTSIIVIVIIVLIAVGIFFVRKANSPVVNELPADSASQGKLNINVVCEGVLAYMTFENQTQADKYVAECKEGKHPDVIERYKTDMNLGAGVEI
jgi:hypothetical protein